MTTKQSAEPRAHHFVPQCWLAGFTDTGEPDGMLYVTDLKRKKQWRCKPSEAGHRRDFNRVDDPSLPDPLRIEKLFSSIESDVAPVFRSLTKEKRGPKDGFELGVLVEYLAIQWARVPSFRAVVRRALESHFHREVLSSPEAWERALKRVGVSPGDPGTDYKKALEGLASGEIKFTAANAFYLKQAAGVLEDADETQTLMKRHWGCQISESGQFIGSDSPVALDGPLDEQVGIGNAPWVSYPVNRHLLLYGTTEVIDPPPLTTKLIARHNTFVMLTADEQVYSHRPDFHWLDSADRCQNDWRLFAEEDFFPI
ncbi:MAG: DUF4238 domain-containing protein [Acidobacteriaceae bacterium]